MKTFYLPPDQWNEPYILDGQEAKHLIKVVRIREEEQITILDGKGREGTFSVIKTEKNKVHLSLTSDFTHPEPTSKAVVAIGWGKSVRRGWLLEKAVELEAYGIWFWQADRSQVKIPDTPKENWEAQMAAGAKQCRNPYLPELRTIPSGVEGLVDLAQDFDRVYILWEGQTPSAMLSPESLGKSGKTLFIVGPEGGFTDREVNILTEAGFTAMSLGRRILRWETAATLCLGLNWWHSQLDASGVKS